MLQCQNRDISATAQKKISDFFRYVRQASARALLLDYDGTLAKFCADPERAVPYSGIQSVLSLIQESANTRLVVVTGRRATDAADLLGVERMEVWGCHGLERLYPNGSYEMPQLDHRVLQAVDHANKLLKSEGLSDLMEHKPAAIAVHWRGMERESAKTVERRVQEIWSTLPDKPLLRLMKFDGGLEIRAAARNKGDAVRAILREIDKGASVAYLGDDQTDEDAFAALQGYGLSVLVRDSYRPTVADVWVRPPEGVLAFLTGWANACVGSH